MKFINRHKELERLDRLSSLPEGGVAVIWGRRRVGKTRLLLEWVQKHQGIYFIADESSTSMQRKYFALAIEKALPGFSSVEYPDWRALLERLARDAKNAKWQGPIVIDELPYLISMSKELPSILQKFIDHEAKQAKLIIALCGSSQRMMQGAILDASAPLYGRAQEIIKLSPLSIGYMEEALKLKTPREIVEHYAIWGGIPRYWELIANHGDAFFEKIDKLVLASNGQLNDEPHRLLLEESPSAISLRPLLDAIGLEEHRLSEIASRVGQPATSLTRPIHRLIELDLIEREVPYGTWEQNSKRVLYKIKDPFLRFWFKVVAPRRSFFSQSPSHNRKQILKKELPYLYSILWENLCRQVVPYLFQEEKGPFFGAASRYWHGKGPEWDILASSDDGKALFVGEAKWIDKTPPLSWIEKTIMDMEKKGFPPVTRNPRASFYYGLFIPEKPKKLDLPPNVKVVDAKEVIQALK